METDLTAESMRTLYLLARSCGLKGDFGRIYSTAAMGGTSLKANLAAAIWATGNYSSGALDAARNKPAKASGTAPDSGAVVQAVAAAMGVSLAASVDADEVRAIVDERLAELGNARSAIEVRVADHKSEIEGSVHERFHALLKIITTRVGGRRLHVWMTGPSGSGKSHLASQLADACGDSFYSTGALQTPFQLVGYVSPNGDDKTLQTPFRLAFERGGVFSIDDCDASDARAFAAFNEALANGRFAFPDRMVEAHPDFVAIASANTWGNGATSEYVGRNRIDAATLTRFVRVWVDYDEKLEVTLAGKHADWARHVQRVRRSAATLGVKALITPRHTLQGAGLLEAGFTRDEVESMTVYAGLDDATRAKLAGASL